MKNKTEMRNSATRHIDKANTATMLRLMQAENENAAKAVGEKSVAMIPVAEINKTTGYIRGGCSPVGMRKLFPTVFDRAVESLPAVCVSGGRIGCQIEVSPGDLLPLVRAKTAPITAD